MRGDYVLLYWKPPDSRNINTTTLVYGYDRWRDRTEQSKVHPEEDVCVYVHAYVRFN
jgi:hypothetical protein